ncbi:retrovirus-related pol polyprotein from transposon TNT 1-94 [Tanacetum coccineum]
MSQEKEAQNKFYKTREDKEIEKVIALENKVKVLDDIVYKTGQSVQTMNMLNRNCKTSFVKPEYLKKAQRANPRLYDIGCYNDNLALMLAPESDETIRLAHESRSKLSDLIKPFDYKNLNNLYDLFVPQREKSPEQRYFSEREYYYADHMNAILDVYTTLDEFTDLQYDYVDQVVKCECLEKELSKSNITSKSFEALQQHAIELELALQQCQEHIKNEKAFKENQLNVFLKEREQYFKIQDLKAQLQDKGIAIRVTSTTSVSRPQLKSNQLEDRVMNNYSQGKKERCKKSKQLIVVPISTREPKRTVNQSAATTLKRTVDLVEIILFIVDSGRSKNMTGDLKLLTNFVEKFLCTMKFRNDQIAPILGYGNLVQGNITVKKVYYVEGLNHNLFSVGQFCDADLEVAFRKSTCYIRDLKGNDLLTATSSQAWLWHHRLSHLNFDTINLLSKYGIMTGLPKLKFVKDHLCSSYELGKAKRKSFKTKNTPSSKRHLQILHMDLCGPMRVESFNGNKYVLVIVDDYSRYTWTHFLRSKDETPEVLIDFLNFVQRGLHAQNRTFVEAARTMLSVAKVPLFFWAEAIATTCFTQNRSLVIPRHEKTPYRIMNGRKPSVKFFHIFGSFCYIVKDGENLDKMKEKAENIHVNFDELPQMVSNHVSSDLVPQCLTTALEHASLSLGPKSQENVPQAAETVTTSNELDLLFSLIFDELLNGTTPVVSKSSIITAADAPNQRQQQHKTLSTSTTIIADIPPLNIQTTPETPIQAPTVTANENINQAETNKE